MQLIATDVPASTRLPAIPPFYRGFLLPTVSLLLALTVLCGWLNRPAPAVDLSRGSHFHDAGVLARWHQGEVVALVRHAERCDRSSNPCLADASGITVDGSSVANQVGGAFKRLGLAHTDVYASPLTRTVQTAAFMFGKGVTSQDWLGNCRTSLEHDMLSHKSTSRNLVLVTHSDCINQLAKQLDPAAGKYDSQYASALFVAVDKTTGKPHLLGYLNADDWTALEQGAQL